MLSNGAFCGVTGDNNRDNVDKSHNGDNERAKAAILNDFHGESATSNRVESMVWPPGQGDQVLI